MFYIYFFQEMIVCHFEIGNSVHHFEGKTQKCSECCFLNENGSRFEVRKICCGVNHSALLHDCEYRVGILTVMRGPRHSYNIRAVNADETDHKENKKRKQLLILLY